MTTKTQIIYKPSCLPGVEALSCTSDFTFPDHLHDGHVLWVNSGGGERFQVKGQSDILQPGCISVIEPLVVHSNRPTPCTNRHLRTLYLGEQFFRYLDKLLTGYGDHPLSLGSVVISKKEQWLQVIALHELILGGTDQIAVEEQALSLFPPLLSTFSKVPVDFAPTSNGQKTLSRVMDYMAEKSPENLSLEKLASVAGCTSFHLMRLFKQHVGTSPHAYLIQLRLERSKGLLDSGQSIADAAFQAGFSDQSHLTRLFKKRFGIPPGSYLQQRSS